MIRLRHDANNDQWKRDNDRWDSSSSSSFEDGIAMQPSRVAINCNFPSDEDLAVLAVWSKIFDVLAESARQAKKETKKLRVCEEPEMFIADVKTPDDIRNFLWHSKNQSLLKTISYLSLPMRKLKVIPKEIVCFPNLQLLNLNFNEISVIPDFIGELTELTYLSVCNNEIKILPRCLGNLVNLERLDFGGNKITEIQCSIEKLSHHLETLRIDGLPHNPFLLYANPFNNERVFQNFFLIETLILNNLQISRIPINVSKMDNLGYLAMQDNSISEIPDWMGSMPCLYELNLRGNLISEVPLSLSNLHQLKTLNLGNNNISKVHDIFINMTKLDRLDLSENALSELPNSIENLENLQTFDLNNNRFTMIPACINHLPYLQVLEIAGNRISKTSDEFDRLTEQLSLLDISGNPIAENETITSDLAS